MTRVRDLRVRPDLLYVANGWSTLVTDVHGRITGTDPQGFFARNTRVLARERITVDGREPTAFSTANVGANAQLSYADIGDGEKLPSEAVYLTIERFVGPGLRTRLGVHNFAAQPRRVEVGVALAADFADTDEAEQGRRRQHGDVIEKWDGDQRELYLSYAHPKLDLAVAMRAEAAVPVRYDDKTMNLALTVAPRESATVDFIVEPIFDGLRASAPPPTYGDTDDPAGRARRTSGGRIHPVAKHQP